jgi:transcriptional regulator with XRE-family HTH domain
MSDEKNRIGSKVRLIRETRNLTVDDVSERTNLSADGIRSIEAGELIPGLTPLIKIARVLGVRLGTFMDDNENIGPVVTRSREEKSVTRFSDRGNAVNSDLDFYSLAQNKAGRHMDPFIIDIFPSSGKEYTMSSHEGEEFIYVLSGEVEIRYGKDTYTLKAGDSIYYDSIVAHHVHSQGTEAAKILAVVHTPA